MNEYFQIFHRPFSELENQQNYQPFTFQKYDRMAQNAGDGFDFYFANVGLFKGYLHFFFFF